jgi:hypothetical protein
MMPYQGSSWRIPADRDITFRFCDHALTRPFQDSDLVAHLNGLTNGGEMMRTSEGLGGSLPFILTSNFVSSSNLLGPILYLSN